MVHSQWPAGRENYCWFWLRTERSLWPEGAFIVYLLLPLLHSFWQADIFPGYICYCYSAIIIGQKYNHCGTKFWTVIERAIVPTADSKVAQTVNHFQSNYVILWNFYCCNVAGVQHFANYLMVEDFARLWFLRFTWTSTAVCQFPEKGDSSPPHFSHMCRLKFTFWDVNAVWGIVQILCLHLSRFH